MADIKDTIRAYIIKAHMAGDTKVTAPIIGNMDVTTAAKLMGVDLTAITPAGELSEAIEKLIFDHLVGNTRTEALIANKVTQPMVDGYADAKGYSTIPLPDKVKEAQALSQAVPIETVEALEDLDELSITSLLDTIKETPQIPLAIVGDAGTGKTSIIKQWATDNGYELNLFLANTASEDDVAGAISPDHVKKLAVSYPLEKLHRSTTTKTVLFLDELNTARREVQDPLLTLIQDRVLPNGTPLHQDTIIVTAINPSATYNNHELSPQLRNRFMWFYHKPTEQTWASWLMKQPLGETDGGKAIVQLIMAGTIKFDRDEAFTEERNEFTTPRSLYNLLTVSGGDLSKTKLLAETLVAGPVAEAIRLHGYNDKDTRSNTFFSERAKVSEQEVVLDADPLASGSTTTSTGSSSNGLLGTSTAKDEADLTAQINERLQGGF